MPKMPISPGANGNPNGQGPKTGADAKFGPGTGAKPAQGAKNASGNLFADGKTPTLDELPDSPFVNPVPGGTDKTLAQVLGEIVWICTQSPQHKSFFLSDLEWMVMTPILLQQFRIFYDSQKPIGVALWAFADADVQTRLASGGARLRPQDWKSGPHLWLVDLIAPFGGMEIAQIRDSMLIDLKKNVFPEAAISFRAAVDGKFITRKL